VNRVKSFNQDEIVTIALFSPFIGFITKHKPLIYPWRLLPILYLSQKILGLSQKILGPFLYRGLLLFSLLPLFWVCDARANELSPKGLAQNGLGIDRKSALKLLGPGGAGYPLARIKDSAEGMERWLGQGESGLAELDGPADNLRRIVLIMAFVRDDSTNNDKHLLDLVNILGLLLPGWQEGRRWLVDALAHATKGKTVSVNQNNIRLNLYRNEENGLFYFSATAHNE
jgi:hypothetical protein